MDRRLAAVLLALLAAVAVLLVRRRPVKLPEHRGDWEPVAG